MQGGEGREEHGPFELAVSAAGCVFAVDRGPGRLGGRGEAGVGGEVGGGGEAGAVADGDQQHCGGPDRDPRRRGQDLGKRVVLQQGFDLGFQGPALFVDGRERAGQEGITTSRVPVPGTTTVCSSRASKMSSISRAAMRGALGRMPSTSLRRPALRSAAGSRGVPAARSPQGGPGGGRGRAPGRGGTG